MNTSAAEGGSFGDEPRPQSQPPEPCYSRICPKRVPTYRKDFLATLADEMKRPDRAPNRDLDILSGIVYFGQFIDHDLTRDRTRLEEDPYPEPTQTRNWRTPRLDLDSVYGNEPSGGTLPEGDYTAYIGDRIRVDRIGDVEADLPRGQDGIPQIPESRNDENLVISQLHVLFLKFHNRVVDLLEDAALNFPAPPDSSLLQRARRFVTWHYQWLVHKRFLPAILHPYVLSEITAPEYRPRLFDAKPGDTVALPIEFTMAAFRFGHSMVRNIYVLNRGERPKLSQLLNRDAKPLPANQIIEWGRFFDASEFGMENAAQRIDTTLAEDFYALADRILLLYKEKGPPSENSLAARTLLRGWKAGLPSGQDLCQIARTPFITFKEKSDRHYDTLLKSGMLRDTPLWFYILHEAEVAGTSFAGEGGRYLGPLGSYIVGEVFEAVLKADLESYLNQKWKPPFFRLAPDGPFHRIDSLRQLAAFATGRNMDARNPPNPTP